MEELTNSELALMGLAAEGQQYAYQMEQTIEMRGMREWTEIGFSSIYYALNRLEQAGLLASRRTDGGARPGRRLYELTGEGRRVYRAEILRRLAYDRPHSSDFDLALANLSAFENDGWEDVRRALDTRRQRLVEAIESVEGKWENLGRGRMPLSAEAVFDHGLMQIKYELSWLEQFQKAFHEPHEKFGKYEKE